MYKKIEITVRPKTGKKRELTQTLEGLCEKIRHKCTVLEFIQKQDKEEFILTASWKSDHEAWNVVRSENFFILTGALHALGDSVKMQINDKPLKEYISSKLTPAERMFFQING